MKEIDIYSLGEWYCFWAVIHNFLGWAHDCPYMTSYSLNPVIYNPEERRKELLKKVVEKGGKLHIYHLFEPFVDSDLIQYHTKFIDNGVRLIKAIVRTDGLEVEWDILDSEKQVLRAYSPPLYDRVFNK